MKNLFTHPRLFYKSALKIKETLTLKKEQAHYLRHVLRLENDAHIILFNGQDGEYLGHLSAPNKKTTSITLIKKLRPQPSTPAPIHLLFAPIKKQRLDFLIEKAVELGATALHPILTDHTENRHIKPERLRAKIIEATQQCERLDLPTLSPLTPLQNKISTWSETDKILWSAERNEAAPLLSQQSAPCAFLIGPEGGFSKQEISFLNKHPVIQAISLGSRILRAETATLFCLSRIS